MNAEKRLPKWSVRYEPSKEKGQTHLACPQVEVLAADQYMAAERGALALLSQGVRLEGLFWLRVEHLGTHEIRRLLVRETQNRELSPITETRETDAS